MTSIVIAPGDVFKCLECGHWTLLTSDFIAHLVERRLLDRSDFILFLSDLKRLRCSVCNAHAVKILPFAEQTPTVTPDPSKQNTPPIELLEASHPTPALSHREEWDNLVHAARESHERLGAPSAVVMKELSRLVKSKNPFALKMQKLLGEQEAMGNAYPSRSPGFDEGGKFFSPFSPDHPFLRC
jgi:hypothetical protein